MIKQQNKVWKQEDCFLTDEVKKKTPAKRKLDK